MEMKAVIEGKRYDTTTAMKIGSGGGMAYPGDFHYIYEALYITPRGNFFLAGEGGPLSRYGRPAHGGGTCGGEGIVPVTKEEALLWCESQLPTDQYEEFFPDMIEDA
jgi:hypothetical protein